MVLKYICYFSERIYLFFIRRFISFYYKIRLKECGKNIIVDTKVDVINPGNVSLGNNVNLNRYAVIQGSEGCVTIGNDVVISYGARILTAALRNGPTTGHEYKDVVIGNNVWISCNVIILPGVTIPDNVIVGAGAVVSKDLESGFVYAGVPAKKIKKLE